MSLTCGLATVQVQHGDKLIEAAEESDAEGCFQLLFREVQSDQASLAAHVTQLTQVPTATPRALQVLDSSRHLIDRS